MNNIEELFLEIHSEIADELSKRYNPQLAKAASDLIWNVIKDNISSLRMGNLDELFRDIHRRIELVLLRAYYTEIALLISEVVWDKMENKIPKLKIPSPELIAEYKIYCKEFRYEYDTRHGHLGYRTLFKFFFEHIFGKLEEYSNTHHLDPNETMKGLLKLAKLCDEHKGVYGKYMFIEELWFDADYQDLESFKNLVIAEIDIIFHRFRNIEQHIDNFDALRQILEKDLPLIQSHWDNFHGKGVGVGTYLEMYMRFFENSIYILRDAKTKEQQIGSIIVTFALFSCFQKLYHLK